MKTIRNTFLLTLGKALTLCGVAVTFAACYGSPPIDPEEYHQTQNNAEEMLLGADQNETAAQNATHEICAETPAEQASQSAQPLP